MQLFTEKQLHRHIGQSHIFSRGHGYANPSHIKEFQAQNIEGGEWQIDAQIMGSWEYFTWIRFDSTNGEIFESDCDCPYDDICKHIAALGLFAIKQNKQGEFFSELNDSLPNALGSLSAEEEEELFRSFESTPSDETSSEYIHISENTLDDLQLRIEKGRIQFFLPYFPPIVSEMFTNEPAAQRFFWKSLFPNHDPNTAAALEISPEIFEDFLTILPEISFLKNKLTLEQLQKYLESYQEYLELPNGEFVQIKNKNALKKLLDMNKKFTKQGEKYKGKLYQMPEVTHFAENSERAAFTASSEFQSFFNEVKSGKPIEKVSMPQGMNKVLRPYQKDGVAWGHFLRKYHFGGILGDDMGLGKTLQTLTLIQSVKSKNPSLIICPKTLIYNWEQEIQKFFPKMKILTVNGATKDREEKIADKHMKISDIVLTSYSLLRQDVPHYKKLKTSFEYVILDEAQNIKNHKTKTAQGVKQLEAAHRLALTGTALENGVSDLWSIFDFLMPQFLGKYEDFRGDFEIPITKYEQQEALELLSSKIRPFMLRRTKEKVLKELPPKIEQEMLCEMTKEQLTLYTHTLAQVKSELQDIVGQKGFERSHIHILAALTKLRQICDHPQMVAPKMKMAHSGKFETVFELLEEVREGNHKVLIFSSFVKALQLLKSECARKKIQFSYLDGQTKEKDRRIAVQQFQEDENISAFLISMKAGGTGLNLTAADTVILLDPWWNPMVEMQATDRVHRIGQKKIVNVYSLITKGTVEEKMLVLKERKKQLFEALVNENQDFIKKLTWKDIENLFE